MSTTDGETKGAVQTKVDQVVQSARDASTFVQEKTTQAATATQEKTTEAVTAAQERAKATADAAQGKKPEPTFMQQTGTQIQNIAQGAVDTVKNTLGVGEQKK